MLKGPQTYKEWIDLLDIFKDGKMDKEVYEAMEKGTLVYQDGVTERFVTELFKVLSYRLEKINEMINNGFKNIKNSDEEVVSVLMGARNSINGLMSLTRVSAFSEEIRGALKENLTKYADSMYSSLIDSAKKDRTGKLNVIIKNNPINKLNDEKVNINDTIGLGKKGARRIVL